MIFKVNFDERKVGNLTFKVLRKVVKLFFVKSCNPRLKNFMLVKFERKKERKFC